MKFYSSPYVTVKIQPTAHCSQNKQSPSVSTMCTKLENDVKDVCKQSLTKQPSAEDNKNETHEFEQYHTLCKLYWQERENNELQTKTNKTFNHQLPPKPKSINVSNKNILLDDINKHKRNMLYLAKYTIEQLSTNEPITYKEWKSKELNLPRDLQPCPCCQYKDYIDKSTIVYEDEH